LFEDFGQREMGEGGYEFVDEFCGFLGDIPAVGVGLAGFEQGFVEDAGSDEGHGVFDAVIEFFRRRGFGAGPGGWALDESGFERHEGSHATREAGEERGGILAVRRRRGWWRVCRGLGLQFLTRAVRGELGQFHADVDQSRALAQSERFAVVAGWIGEGRDCVQFGAGVVWNVTRTQRRRGRQVLWAA